jgi:hypothetical protein
MYNTYSKHSDIKESTFFDCPAEDFILDDRILKNKLTG